jgi:hypothetical protein
MFLGGTERERERERERGKEGCKSLIDQSEDSGKMKLL